MSVHPCVLPPQQYRFEEYPKWVGDRLVNSAEEEFGEGFETAEDSDAAIAEEGQKPRRGRPRKNP